MPSCKVLEYGTVTEMRQPVRPSEARTRILIERLREFFLTIIGPNSLSVKILFRIIAISLCGIGLENRYRLLDSQGILHTETTGTSPAQAVKMGTGAESLTEVTSQRPDISTF